MLPSAPKRRIRALQATRTCGIRVAPDDEAGRDKTGEAMRRRRRRRRRRSRGEARRDVTCQMMLSQTEDDESRQVATKGEKTRRGGEERSCGEMEPNYDGTRHIKTG
jgi:hypothetical protein